MWRLANIAARPAEPGDIAGDMVVRNRCAKTGSDEALGEYFQLDHATCSTGRQIGRAMGQTEATNGINSRWLRAPEPHRMPLVPARWRPLGAPS